MMGIVFATFARAHARRLTQYLLPSLHAHVQHLHAVGKLLESRCLVAVRVSGYPCNGYRKMPMQLPSFPSPYYDHPALLASLTLPLHLTRSSLKLTLPSTSSLKLPSPSSVTKRLNQLRSLAGPGVEARQGPLRALVLTELDGVIIAPASLHYQPVPRHGSGIRVATNWLSHSPTVLDARTHTPAQVRTDSVPPDLWPSSLPSLLLCTPAIQKR